LIKELAVIGRPLPLLHGSGQYVGGGYAARVYLIIPTSFCGHYSCNHRLQTRRQISEIPL